MVAAASGTSPTTSSGTSSSAAAAEQAAAQAAAAAAARRAEEARRQAAEQARREAEAARRQAEAAREQAQVAQRQAAQRTAAAKEKREAADTAAQSVTARRRLLAGEGGTIPPEERATYRRAIDADQRHATRLAGEATAAEGEARTARATAIREGNAALEAERTANSRAAEARQPRPYPDADRVVDVLDAGSLDRERQIKLLGAPAAVSPDEAARADATRIADAAERGPVEGAEALDLAMRESDDPAYRRALADATEPTVEKIAADLTNNEQRCFSTDEQTRALDALGHASSLVGPDRARNMADAFTRGLPEQNDNLSLAGAFGVASKEPGVAQFGADVADELAARGDYGAAQAISEASPELKAKKAVDAGELAARDAVEVDGDATADQRAALEDDIGKTDRATRAQVDGVFDRAGGADLPSNTTATVDGDRAEIVTRDRQGNITAREVAIRDGEDVTYQRTDYRGGNATRQSYEARGDEVTVTTADWKQPASASPADPSWDELSARAEGGESGIALREVNYHDTGDTLETRERVVNEEGRNEVSRSYKTQTGGDGIHGTPEQAFDTDSAINVVSTESVSKKWGEDEEKSKEWVYEQGDVRATAVDGEGDDVPKQWRLEKQDGNVYRSQTFVEGNEDFTTITERRAEGSSVYETSTSRGVDEDGDAYEVESTANTAYSADGGIASQHIDRTDPDGTRTQLDYWRNEDAQGRIHEESHSTVTAPDGVQSEAIKSIDSVRENGEERITGLSTTTRGPGGEATSTFTETGGQQLTVNGTPVPISEGSAQLDALTDAEKDLAAGAAADTLTTLKQAADRGRNIVDLAKLAGVGASNAYTRGTSVADQFNRRIELQKVRLENRFGDRFTSAEETLLRGASGAKVGAGALGALASGASLIESIQQHNWVKAGIDTGGVAVGGASAVAGVKELSALRATPNGALVLDDLGSVAGKFGTFAKFGGLAVGVAAGGYQVVDGIKNGDGVGIAQGGVGIAGTIGAFALGGAVGGPAGVLVGVGIGLATLGVQWGIGKLFGNDEPKMAKLEI